MTLKFHPKIHSELINLCADVGTMENCHEFQEIASLLRTANDFVKDFNKIRFKGGMFSPSKTFCRILIHFHILGNERYIQEISTRLGSYLKRANFAEDSNGTINVICFDKVRKILWYMMLNTEHDYTYNFDEDSNIGHCLQTLPTLTPCLLLEILWLSQLDEFLYEIVAYTPTWFLITWFDDILESLRSMESFVLLKRVQYLLMAVLTHLRILCTQKSLSWETMEMYLEKISDFIAALLCHFNTPPGQMEKWASMKKSKYYGYAMYYLLSVTQQGMLMYGGRDGKEIDSTLIRFYEINVDLKEALVKKETDPEEFNNDESLKVSLNFFSFLCFDTL